ncbi:hypothetical protein XENTR_v10005671 [Xenopus tropicalis]|nr:hypothetical protein XENTR_v10005671 [Xenopus tropicalis]
MPSTAGDHSQLSKDQLKNLLISHNIPLPPSDQRKAVYLELYNKHIFPKDKEAVEFSSDDEEMLSENHLLPVEDEEWNGNCKMDVRSLSNTELQEQLLKHGVKPGPILPTTRGVYEKRLQQLLDEVLYPAEENRSGNQDQYSDSEDEGVLMKKKKEMRGETMAADAMQNNGQTKPEDSTLEDFSESMSQSPLGLSATRRKPIKGAAGRPIQFRYDDFATQARIQEKTKAIPAEKSGGRLISVPLQIVIFIVLAFLALVFFTLEGSPDNPFRSLVESEASAQQP